MEILLHYGNAFIGGLILAGAVFCTARAAMLAKVPATTRDEPYSAWQKRLRGIKVYDYVGRPGFILGVLMLCYGVAHAG